MRILLRTVILLATLGLMVFVYYGFYGVDINSPEIEIGEYIDQEVTIDTVKKIHSGHNMTFTFEYNHATYKGSAQLELGYNNKYRIVRLAYKKLESPIRIYHSTENGLHYVDFKGGMESFKTVTLYSKSHEPIILDELTELQVPFSREDFVYYDIERGSSTNSYSFHDDIDPEYQVYRGETVLVYASLGLIFIAGFSVFSYYSKEVNVLERIYNKFTKKVRPY